MENDKLGTLIAMYGLPRSGKSTISRELAKELNAPIVNQDNIRLALHGQVYAKEAEAMVRAIYKVMIHSLFLSGHKIVIADETHWSRAKRDFVKDGPWETLFYEVPTPPEVCLKRAEDTNQPWLYTVIKEMAERTEPLTDDEDRYKGHRSTVYCELISARPGFTIQVTSMSPLTYNYIPADIVPAGDSACGQ